MSRLLRSTDRKGSDRIAREDLFAEYDELLRLRQRVKIAECGRAIGPPGLRIPTPDTKMN